MNRATRTTAATRINKPLLGWKRVLPARIQRPLGRLWLSSLIITAGSFVFALAIAITGFVPAVADPDAVLSVMLVALATATLLLPLTLISGFAHDISAPAGAHAAG